MNFIRRIGHPDAPQVIERDRESLSLAHRRDHRDEERDEEECREDPARRAVAEVERDDAEEDRDAIGDDHERPDVAVVAQVQDTADGTALVRFDPANEERAFAAAGTTAPPSTTEDGADRSLQGLTTISATMFVCPMPHSEFVQMMM
jgi:hypothetical protein